LLLEELLELVLLLLLEELLELVELGRVVLELPELLLLAGRTVELLLDSLLPLGRVPLVVVLPLAGRTVELLLPALLLLGRVVAPLLPLVLEVGAGVRELVLPAVLAP
jgi:hypothetical protein